MLRINSISGADEASATPTDVDSYRYDEAGNRTSGDGVAFTPGLENRLTLDTACDYTYDDQGRLALKAATDESHTYNYTWDHRGLLLKVERTGTEAITVEYGYDASGRRTARRATDGIGTITEATITHYDGMNRLAEFDVKPGSANEGKIVRHYLYGTGPNEVLAVDQGGQTAWALADQLGSVVTWGTYDSVLGEWTLQHQSFDAFGNLDGSTAALMPGGESLPTIWAGHQFDAATDLYHMQARWYDPRTGQFLSLDPLSFAAGDANLYRYVGNDPVNAVDPDGMERKVGKYLVTGTGHHIIPVELWTEFGFSPELYKYLDSYGLLKPPSHDRWGHGPKTGYTGFLRAELRERLAEHLADNPEKKLAVLEQHAFLKEFIDDVKAGKVKRAFIKDFNAVAVEEGIDGVKHWVETSRHKYPKVADEVAPIAIAGLRSISKSRAAKLIGYLGHSPKLAGKVVPFVAALTIYNEARANGNDPAEAAFIAGLEEINPIPVGYSEIHAAGKAYEDAMTRAIGNNVHGRGGVISFDAAGFPILPQSMKKNVKNLETRARVPWWYPVVMPYDFVQAIRHDVFGNENARLWFDQGDE